MKCPWLIKTTTQTNNKNSYNESVRVEFQEFSNCMKKDCPFYRVTNEKETCTRVQEQFMFPQH